MINRRTMLIGIVCAIILACAVFLSMYGRGTPERTPEGTPEEAAIPTPQPASADSRLPDSEFRLDTQQPHLLWDNGSSTLYMENRKLYARTADTAAVSLYEWKEAYVARAWLNGDRLLIGVQTGEPVIGPAAMDAEPPGHWLGVHVGTTPAVDYDRTAFFGPREVLQMLAAEQPRLFIATVVNGEGYSEHLLDPALNDWITVHRGRLESLPEGGSPQSGMRYMTEGRIYQPAEGAILHTYEDNGDTLIYSKAPFLYARRFPNLKLQDVKEVNSTQASPQRFGRFHTEGKEDVMLQLYGNYDDTPIPLEPRLWEEDWTLLDPYPLTFVQARPDKLEMLQYTVTYPGDGEQHIAGPERSAFPTAGWRLLEQRGSVATYASSEGRRLVSWHDLLHAEWPPGQPLWLTPLQNYKSRVETRPDFAAEWKSPRIPVIEHQSYNTNADIPDELFRAMEEVLADSDYGYCKTFRLIGNTWYVLYDNHFFEYKEGVLRRMGEMPVTVMVSVSEAWGGRTARDFIRVDGYWIVADTEGSRVLKLNEQLEIIAEAAVAAPYQLSAEEERLTVASAGSLIAMDLNLVRIEQRPLPFQNVANAAYGADIGFRAYQYTEDQEHGLAWYYYDGILYQYRERNKELRSFYIGYNENLAGTARILPYRDEMLVMLDRRLERFDRQGNWLGRIDYPRSQPDGIYDRTPHGENTHVLDDARGVLYLVQGYRIIAIDLQSNAVRPLFRQNNSDIGKLIRYKDHLYFLLHSNANDRFEQRNADPAAGGPFYTELVKLNMADASTERFVAEGYYEDMEVRDGADGSPFFTLKRYSD